MSKEIKFNVRLNVDGKEQLVTAAMSAEELGRNSVGTGCSVVIEAFIIKAKNFFYEWAIHQWYHHKGLEILLRNPLRHSYDPKRQVMQKPKWISTKQRQTWRKNR